MEKTALVSEELAAFVNGDGAIPPGITSRAKLLMLDAIGIALASSPHDFAETAVRAMRALSPGDAEVIGRRETLSLRDAALVNATLVHGLDYDDTYLPGLFISRRVVFPSLSVSLRSPARAAAIC